MFYYHRMPFGFLWDGVCSLWFSVSYSTSKSQNTLGRCDTKSMTCKYLF